MNRMTKALILIVTIGLVVGLASDALAQRIDRGRTGTIGGEKLQYVVKFVCGGDLVDYDEASDEELPTGTYYTDVNIHNPNDRIVNFRKKIALVGELPQHHGLKTSPVDVDLGADEALQINCTDILRLLGEGDFNFNGDAFEGYVVLYSRQKLDVASIYTATNAGNGGGFITTAQFVQPIAPSPVPAPDVYIDGLSVNSSSVDLSLKPFSRFAYESARLQVFNAGGVQLHDSGFVNDTRLSWHPLTQSGQTLANGVYFYVVEVKDVMGQTSREIGKFMVLR